MFEQKPFAAPRKKKYAHYDFSLSFEALQPQVKYDHYPFDNFELSIPLTVPGFEITNCANNRLNPFLHPSLMNQDGSIILTKQTRLLPDNRGWETHCNFDQSAIRISRPLLNPESGRDAQIDVSACEIRILVRRRTAPFVYKALFPVIITVVTGLLGLFLDPRVPPLVTGRCSLLIIAMLLTINIARAAPTFAYDTWYDGWSMMQLIILTTGIFETIIVHVLTKFPRPELPMAVDEAARIFIPFLYIVMASYMLSEKHPIPLNDDLANIVSSVSSVSALSQSWASPTSGMHTRSTCASRGSAPSSSALQVEPEDAERSNEALTGRFTSSTPMEAVTSRDTSFRAPYRPSPSQQEAHQRGHRRLRRRASRRKIS